MKNFASILLVLIIIFTITGCPEGEFGGGIFNSTRKFWAQDTANETFYQLEAEKLAENSRCEVWAEIGSGVTEATANNVASQYANSIYVRMIDAFGWNENVLSRNMNTMDYAHYLATGKTSGAKLTILLLDIKDGYKPGVNDSYVAGYFWVYDILSTNLPNGYKSNVLDMIYIDTNPGLTNSNISTAYMTLAHEMQHLMNFVSSVKYRVNSNYIYPMDTWIDEGLSSAAEWVFLNGHNTSKTTWFNKNGDGKSINGKIDVGNNFYVWNNRTTTSDPYPVLDDYATVYLFFQWLRLQSDNRIYKEIIKSTYYDQRAVISAFKNITGAAYSDWGTMLKDWLAANNTNSTTGRDGYKDDPILKSIKAPYAPAGITNISLFPGEGVYSYSTANPSLSPSGNIKYEYFSGNKTLLTYNANPINDDSFETGATTGQKPSASTIPGIFSVQLDSSVISGPFPIGMGDVIRMKQNGGGLKFDVSTLERVFIDE